MNKKLKMNSNNSMPFKNNVLTVLDQYNAYLNKIITFLQTPNLCFF